MAWHPSKWWDCCVPEDETKEREKKLTTLHTEIKNILIKEDVETLVKKRLQLKTFMDKDK